MPRDLIPQHQTRAILQDIQDRYLPLKEAEDEFQKLSRADRYIKCLRRMSFWIRLASFWWKGDQLTFMKAVYGFYQDYGQVLRWLKQDSLQGKLDNINKTLLPSLERTIMRIAIIRGDIQSPIYLADLEPTTQYDPMYESAQSKYLSRPTSTSVGAVQATNNPASLVSTANITFPLVINGGNQMLKLKSAAADPFTSFLIPTGTYANITTLLAAINSVLGSAFVAVPLASSPTLRIALATTAKGQAVRIQYDTTAGGSTANTPLSLAAGGATFTTPTAVALITATVPVGGPINVSTATILTNAGAGLTTAQVRALQESLAPSFIDSEVAIQSFQVGYVSKLLSTSFNPDPSRKPALPNGPAVIVVQDDGSTLFTAPVPNITNAQFNVPVAGAITITGVGLAGPGSPNSEIVKTSVKVLTSPEPRTVKQKTITSTATGVVSATSIVIPASKVPTGTAVGTKVQVQYGSLVSNQFALV